MVHFVILLVHSQVVAPDFIYKSLLDSVLQFGTLMAVRMCVKAYLHIWVDFTLSLSLAQSQVIDSGLLKLNPLVCECSKFCHYLTVFMTNNVKLGLTVNSYCCKEVGDILTEFV